MLPRLEWRMLPWNEYQLELHQQKYPCLHVNYVPEALIRFQHTPLAKPQHQPYPHIKPVYGATKQYAETIDMSPALSKEDKKYVQEVFGTFLYYA
jgi:hypothetical protein